MLTVVLTAKSTLMRGKNIAILNPKQKDPKAEATCLHL